MKSLAKSSKMLDWFEYTLTTIEKEKEEPKPVFPTIKSKYKF